MKKMEFDWSLIGGIAVLVLGTFIGTYLIHYSNRKANTTRIEALENTFTKQNKDLKGLSTKLNNTADSINEISKQTNTIAEEVLGSSKKLNETTERISQISNTIEELSRTNNQIVNTIRSEHKEKGSIKLNIPKSEKYIINIGMNTWAISRETLLMGTPITLPSIKLPIVLKIEEDELLILLELRDRNFNLILNIIKNEWVLNRSSIFSLNYDENALEILDEKGFVTFQLNIIKNQIFISMILQNPEEIIFIGGNGINTAKYEDPETNITATNYFRTTGRIFKHQGEDAQGKRN